MNTMMVSPWKYCWMNSAKDNQINGFLECKLNLMLPYIAKSKWIGCQTMSATFSLMSNYIAIKQNLRKHFNWIECLIFAVSILFVIKTFKFTHSSIVKYLGDYLFTFDGPNWQRALTLTYIRLSTICCVHSFANNTKYSSILNSDSAVSISTY